MVGYNIIIKPSALKEIEQAPKKTAQQIIKKITLLGSNPRPLGSKKLSAEEKYRIRQGNFRIIYQVNDKNKIVEIVKIGQRKEVYR